MANLLSEIKAALANVVNVIESAETVANDVSSDTAAIVPAAAEIVTNNAAPAANELSQIVTDGKQLFSLASDGTKTALVDLGALIAKVSGS